MLRGGIHNSPPSPSEDEEAGFSRSNNFTSSECRQNQLLYIRKLISLSRAFSIHYYQRARFWKYVYWTLSASGLGLTAINTMINAFFNPCSENISARNVNVAIGSIIMAMLSGISVLNAPLRQKHNEEAGDKYNATANNIFVEVFCSDYPAQDHDLKSIIDKYVMHLNELSDRYEEPCLTTVNNIMGSDEYEFLMRIDSRIDPVQNV